MKPIDLAKIFPIQSIEEGCLINGNGDITFGFSVLLPEAFTVSLDAYNDLQLSIAQLFSRLPSGTLIHKQDFFYLEKYQAEYSKATNYSKVNNLRYFDQRPVLRHYSNIYFTLSSNMEFNTIGKKTSFTGLLDFVFKKPFKDFEKQLSAVRSLLTTVEPGLNAIPKLKVTRLNDIQLQNALQDLWNLEYMNPSIKDEAKTLQPWEIENDFKIGDEYVSILSMVEEGSEVAYAKNAKTSAGNLYGNDNRYSNSIGLPTSMTFPIGLGLPINHVLNTTIEIMDYDWLSSKLDMEKRKTNILAGAGYSPALLKNQEIEFYLSIISGGTTIPCRTSVNVILHHKDKEKLREYVALTETAFSNMNGSKVWKENFDNGNIFVASTPGNYKSNYRGFYSTVDQSVSYFTKESHYRSDGQGNLFVDRFGNMCMVDMWDSPYITNNRNKVIFGPSGTGKSFFINGLIDESIYNGNHVIVLDVGGSYKKNCYFNEGLYFDSKEKDKLSFNIFLCPRNKEGRFLYDIDDEGRPSDDKINFVYSVISYIWKGEKSKNLEKAEKQLLRSIIKGFYDHINEKSIFPTVIEFYNYLPVFEAVMDERDKKFIDIRSIQITLDGYVNGEYKALLNSTSNVDIKDYKYIVFDVEAIQKNPDIRNIISIIIIELVMDKMASLPLTVHKSFIIDEAIDFLIGGDMADFIGGMYRKIRKKGGEIYLATQDASFLEECDDLVRKSIIQNTEVKILLDHRSVKSTYKILRDMLSFTDSDIELLDSIENGPNYREFFIKINNVSRVFRNENSIEAQAVYTTSANELGEIEKLYERLGNLGSAINQYVENKKNKIYEKVY